MKKILFLLLLISFFYNINPVISMANHEIKDFEKLIIYIKNKEYSKDKVFLKDKILYTTISSLAKMLKFNYSYEKKGQKLYIEKEEYKGDYFVKGQNIYVPLEKFSIFLGYYINYNRPANILDISLKSFPNIIITHSDNSGVKSANQGSDVTDGCFLKGSDVTNCYFIRGETYNTHYSNTPCPQCGRNKLIDIHYNKEKLPNAVNWLEGKICVNCEWFSFKCPQCGGDVFRAPPLPAPGVPCADFPVYSGVPCPDYPVYIGCEKCRWCTVLR